MSAAHPSISSRFVISLLGNGARSLFSMLAGLVIARNLGPADYGSFAFLTSTFVALCSILHLGTPTAFFTFISQEPRSPRFYAVYAAWQLAQFVLPLAAIGLIMPERLIELLWVGHHRRQVLLAFFAIFMQQQLWATVSQIAEAKRLTRHGQVFGMVAAGCFLASVLALARLGLMSQDAVFVLIGATNLVASVALIARVGSPADAAAARQDLSAMIVAFARYCRPLFIGSLVGFACTFADNWLLQRLGGAVQQGYFSIGNQLGTVTLIATASLVQIFWREMAERFARPGSADPYELFQRSTRVLLFIASASSSFLIPWSAEILQALLGAQYRSGWPVLALMLFFPVHTAISQTLGAVYYASGRVKPHVSIVMATMVMGLPISYFAIAPNGSPLPGLGLGSTGLAIKLVVMQVLTINLLWWWICRALRWKYDWPLQIYVPAVFMLISALVNVPAQLALGASAVALPPVFAAAVACYAALVGAALWRWPALAGYSRDAMAALVRRALRRAL